MGRADRISSEGYHPTPLLGLFGSLELRASHQQPSMIGRGHSAAGGLAYLLVSASRLVCIFFRTGLFQFLFVFSIFQVYFKLFLIGRFLRRLHASDGYKYRVANQKLNIPAKITHKQEDLRRP